MPNIKLLSKYSYSALLDAIQATDKMKIERQANKLEAQLEVVSVIKTGVA